MPPIDREQFATLEEDRQEMIDSKTDELVDYLKEHPDKAYSTNELQHDVLGEFEVDMYEMEEITEALTEHEDVEYKQDGSEIYFAIKLNESEEY